MLLKVRLARPIHAPAFWRPSVIAQAYDNQTENGNQNEFGKPDIEHRLALGGFVFFALNRIGVGFGFCLDGLLFFFAHGFLEATPLTAPPRCLRQTTQFLLPKIMIKMAKIIQKLPDANSANAHVRVSLIKGPSFDGRLKI